MSKCLWLRASARLSDLRTKGLSVVIAERAHPHCAHRNNEQTLIHRCPHPNPRTWKYAALLGKRAYAGVIKVRVFRWEGHPASGRAQRSHRILIKQAGGPASGVEV